MDIRWHKLGWYWFSGISEKQDGRHKFKQWDFVSLVIEINIQRKKNIIGEIYWVPNTNEQLSIERYETLISKVNCLKIDILLATDKNFDLLKIDKHKNTSHLFNLFTSSGFIPTITRPTRITHTFCTLIDNIYTNITTSVQLFTLVYLLMTFPTIFQFSPLLDMIKHVKHNH